MNTTAPITADMISDATPAPAEAVTKPATAHAECTHPRTKVARAACRRARRSGWTVIARGDVDKGDTVRVTLDGNVTEGVMLGWGEKRLIVRDDDNGRVTFAITEALIVEAPTA